MKETEWGAWKAFPDLIDTFEGFLQIPRSVSEGSLEELERFAVIMYDRTSYYN